MRQASIDAFRKTGATKIELQPDSVGPNPTRESAIKAFVDVHRNGQLLPDPNDNEVQLNLGPVLADNAARVLRDSGVDIAGLRRTIDTRRITHAFQHHGAGNEKDPSQLPISPEAVSVYLDVVESYDRVTVRRRKAGTISLTYEKRINGTLFVVEERRRETLAFYTMWIKAQ